LLRNWRYLNHLLRWQEIKLPPVNQNLWFTFVLIEFE
jgi:hypothetical protein